MREIYLDNSATTKISREALDKYIEISSQCYGNPSSLHAYGFRAEKILTQARAEILSSLGAVGSTVIFCGSGSEANNLAIFGRAYSKERYKRGAKIIITDSEHASVSECISRLEKEGFKVEKIPTKCGKIDTGALSEALTPDTVLVSVMMVNNETGALYDVAAVSRLARAKAPDAYVHVDATQSYMKLPFTKSSLGADMITLSSHKIEGPKGVGALVIDPRVVKERGLTAITLGGGQELGLRSGTENVPAIAAFGEAVRIGAKNLRSRYEKMRTLRDHLIKKLDTSPALSEISVTNPEKSAPHILNITLPKIKSETMLHFLSSRGIYVSSGSACSSNSHHLSSSLIAYGRTREEADCSIRISFSHTNELSDVDALIDALTEGLAGLARIR
ncbi:MAG: cysteine desulfurase [Clostridia bacterium]|nr:cysteine desulfurase [Clostridia bacterium]